MRLIPPKVGRAVGAVHFDGRDLLALPGDEMRRVRSQEISMIFQEPMTSLNPAFTIGNQIAEVVRTHQGVSKKAAWAHAVEMLDRVGIANASARAGDYPHAFSGGMRQRAMIAMALCNEPKLLVADEPTTALDVTIQAQILELLAELQRDLGMAVLFVTHDLGVVAQICERVVVMYAGQVVEEETVDALFAQPLHPYTEGLLDSMPQVSAKGSELHVIPGQVPRADEMPAGCRFHPRCSYAAQACTTRAVELEPHDGGLTRCLRVDELTLRGGRTDALRGVEAPAGVPEGGPTSGDAGVLVDVRGLSKAFPVHSGLLRRVTGEVRAVDGVDFTIERGETLGLVGESGSGKSTVARLVLRLIDPSAGVVDFDGSDIAKLDARALKAARRDMQIVFQDPYSSLDPRSTVAASVGEPLTIYEGLKGRAREQRVLALLRQVGLGAEALSRYPHQFSGGQRQRIAIARALALQPALLVCDEPLSSLDVSTQSQVINLLDDLQEQLGLTYLFISHDLAVVRHISDRIAVMYLGRIVELGAAEEVYGRPTHPYTEALLSAIPVPDPVEQRRRSRIVLQGDIPSPLAPPSGCRFHPRCPYAMDVCRDVDPPAYTTPAGTTVYCHLHTSGPTLAGRPVTVLGTEKRE
jgi:peptide/nickel transport system ATP-binding protein